MEERQHVLSLINTKDEDLIRITENPENEEGRNAQLRNEINIALLKIQLTQTHRSNNIAQAVLNIHTEVQKELSEMVRILSPLAKLKIDTLNQMSEEYKKKKELKESIINDNIRLSAKSAFLFVVALIGAGATVFILKITGKGS